LIN
jgi:hypothetical protein